MLPDYGRTRIAGKPRQFSLKTIDAGEQCSLILPFWVIAPAWTKPCCSTGQGGCFGINIFS